MTLVTITAVQWAEALREAKAEAWNRGFDRGWYAALENRGETIPNPYRAEREGDES